MKTWAIYTAALYALALILLTAPITLVAFADWGTTHMEISLRDLYSTWVYWLWLGILLVGQILLLLVPIDISEKRLPSRRKLKVPIVVSAFFLANLLFAGIISILCVIFKDGAGNIFSFTDWILGHRTISQPPEVATTNFGIWTTIILIIGTFWIIWGILFSRFAKSDNADSLIKRAMHWLLRGSILELLVAVPSHIIVRRRDDCCAPAGTFWRIATGISVMLLCFGPGVYFLFVERMSRLQPKSTNAEKQN